MSLTEEDKVWIESLMKAQALAFTRRFEAIETVFAERLEATETRLLTEFHKSASPIDMRLRSHAATLRALDLEQEAFADRVPKLEGNAS